MGSRGRSGDRRAAEELRGRLEAKYLRSSEWNGLADGDIVRVRGERGARFVFRSHVLNRTNEATWVEVDELARPRRGGGTSGAPPPAARGGPPRRVVRRQRSFSEDRIVPERSRRERRPPQGVQGRFDLIWER